MTSPRWAPSTPRTLNLVGHLAGIWFTWIVASGITFWLVASRNAATGDVHYYYRGMHEPLASDHPLAEYPDAGTWPLRIVYALSPGDSFAFVDTFARCAVGLSASFLVLLCISGWRRRNLRGAWTWALFVACIGPILLVRLDLVPGLLVALVFALLARHPRVSAALLALATLSKLWPGVLAATLVGSRKCRSTWVRLGWFAGALTALAAVSAVAFGVSRLVSPLTYQSHRGLQIESIAATPFIVAAWLDPSRWEILHSDASRSYEVIGPGVALAAHASTAVMGATLLLALTVAIRRFLRGGWTPEAALFFGFVLACLLIVGNKVFSPQYLVWIAPLLALLAARNRAPQGSTNPAPTSAVDPRTPAARALIPTRYLGLFLLVSVLTMVIYPSTYDSLIHTAPSATPVIALAVRNLGMLVLTVWACALWVGTLRTSPLPTQAPTWHSEPAAVSPA